MIRVTPIVTAIFIFAVFITVGAIAGADKRGTLPAALAAAGIATIATQERWI